MSKKKRRWGKIHPASTMLLRRGAGKAEDEKGDKSYEMSIGITSRTPIIRSNQTRKWWTLSWEGLLALAIAEGIDEEG